MPPASDPVVAVVIPAHNAQHTLDRTLRSVRSQTHSALEIVVVDDASSDTTADIVLAHERQDSRVRLLRNPVCGGVGAARNRGAMETAAAYLTFLDADDLMTADSVAARLDALVAAGAGMAYCWSAIIDADDRVRGMPCRPTFAGCIFQDLLRGNFISNGSAILCTREAFEAVGGFSEALYKVGAQGCEDYQLYLELARRFPVACVPRVLVGYRETPDNMSSDGARMLRSLELVHAGLLKAEPELEPSLRAVRHNLRLHYAGKMVRARRVAEGLRLVAQVGLSLPRHAYAYARRNLGTFVRRNVGMERRDLPVPLGSRFPYAPEANPTHRANAGDAVRNPSTTSCSGPP